jgi:RNA polymerase sigma-70 factor (ECF subfamily)
MSQPLDVSDCVRRVNAGDLAAAQELIQHLHPLVQRWVRNHLPRRESEEDLMQEVFLKLLQKLPQYQERAGVPFEHWVSRLTVRTCLDALRAERSRPEWRMADLSDGGQEWLDYLTQQQAPPPTAHCDAQEARDLVLRLLAQLSPQDRLVLTLLDLEQRSTLEISQLIGWSRPMIKMRAMRARQKLRRIAKQLKIQPF